MFPLSGSPFYRATSIAIAALILLLLNNCGQFDSLFPDSKVSSLFGTQRVADKVWNNDCQEIRYAPNLKDSLIASVFREVALVPAIASKQRSALPECLNETKYLTVVVSQANTESHLRLQKSNPAFTGHGKTKVPFSIGQSTQPVTEGIPVNMAGERFDRIGLSHDRSPFAFVVRAAQRDNAVAARFILSDRSVPCS